MWLAREGPPCCGPGAAEVTGQSWVFRDRLDLDMDIGGFREPPHWLQRAGTRELARQPVLAKPDLLPHNIQESHLHVPPTHPVREPPESRRVKLLAFCHARSEAADDAGQLGFLSFLVLLQLSCVPFLLPLTAEVLSSSPRSRIFEEGGCYHLPGWGRGLK